jgi:flagellar hook-basal body complex protein FliE
MINGIDNNLPGSQKLGGVGAATTSSRAAGASSGASFTDALKSSIDEVAKLQQDASKAVENLAAGRTEDVAGVMTAMEKSDVAFKTLLAIRNKLMDAYEEVKSISI